MGTTHSSIRLVLVSLLLLVVGGCDSSEEGSSVDLTGVWQEQQDEEADSFITFVVIEGRQGIIPDFEVPPHIIEKLRSPEGKALVKSLNVIYNIYRAKATGDVKGVLDALLEKSPEERAIKTLHLVTYALSAGSAVLDGDIIVSANSQLSGEEWGASNTSVFGLVSHAFLSSAVTKSPEVGDKVFDLLNSSVESDEFAPLPATSSSTSSSQYASKGANSLGEGRLVAYATPEPLQIVKPQEGGEAAVDSTLDLRVEVPDTTGLSYVQVFFQNETYLTTDQANSYRFALPVSGAAIDEQSVSVLAFYDYADSTAIAGDDVRINVSPNSPIQRFSASPYVMRLWEGTSRTPKYEAVFEQSIATLGSGSTDLTANVADPSVVEFDQEYKSFEKVGEGETWAVVSYRGQSDTLYFPATVIPDSVNIEPPPEELPDQFLLNQNYPNPFTVTTTITYTLPEPQHVTITVYDVLGRNITTLVDEQQEAGEQAVSFDAGRLASGVYFYRLTTEAYTDTRKMVVVK